MAVSATRTSLTSGSKTGGGGLAGFHREINEWAGSASIKHKPTGLFAFGAFSVSDDDDFKPHKLRHLYPHELA